jgi:Fe-S-cluster containining protein
MLVDCLDCARCCTYVAIDIDPPSRPRYALEILRLLDHEAVSVRCDEEGDWYVQFETRCRQLADDHKCRIYPHRPHICRGYDNTACEVNRPSDLRVYHTREEFLAWLARERPRVHRALAADGSV